MLSSLRCIFFGKRTAVTILNRLYPKKAGKTVHGGGRPITGIKRAETSTAWQFTLYILNETPNNQQVYQNLIDMCESYIPDNYHIETVNVSLYPEIAENSKILALPTLIREAPLPKIRIVGDLSHQTEVAKSLNLNPFHTNFLSEQNLSEQRKMLLVSVRQMIDSFYHISKLLGSNRKESPGLLNIFNSIVNSSKRIIKLENDMLMNRNRTEDPGVFERREKLLDMIEEKKKSALKGIIPLTNTITYIEENLNQEFPV